MPDESSADATRDLDDALQAILDQSGVSHAGADAAKAIDGILQNWRRKFWKRELGHQAVQRLEIGLDLAQVDVLAAIEGRSAEFGQTEGEETMVATVADRVGIDPSRGSRIVSELVNTGYAVRVASQADARRTIIALSDKGRAVVHAVRAYRWLLMGDFMAGWSQAEMDSFVPLLQRFSQWSEDLDERTAKFSTEIDALAQTLHEVQDK